MTNELFDLDVRAMRRDRAARQGAELFLLDRAFDDCLERLSLVRREFSSALLLGCPNPQWVTRLRPHCERLDVFDPGAVFAHGAGGRQSEEAALPVLPESYDLIVAVGTLDTVNALADILLRLRFALRPDGLLIGTVSGGGTLPQLRSAMRAADEAAGAAMPHIHPRIEPSALAGLLTAAGFVMPVVDVDRVRVSYSSLRRLIRDLRGMAATNILRQRSKKSLSRKALDHAERAFAAAGEDMRTTEIFELLHFAAWTAADPDQPPNPHG